MHLRERHILNVFQKRSYAFPIVGLLGARQCGKSTFLKSIWCEKINGRYLTLDRPAVRDRMTHESEHYLLAETDDLRIPAVIDEAHKAPVLFDVLKLLADERKKRGFCALSGSVEFSLASGVRESLAGRMGMCRLFPFTLRELSRLPFAAPFVQRPKSKSRNNMVGIKARDLDIYVERGGLPITCQLGDKNERALVFDEWLDALCFRDLMQIKGGKLDGETARRLLGLIARKPGWDKGLFARELGISPAFTERHLKALEALFVIYRRDPHPKGRGKTRYVVFDIGLARHLGAAVEDSLFILFINEVLAQHEYSGERRPVLHYYESKHGYEIPLLLERKDGFEAFEVRGSETVPPFLVRSLESAGRAVPIKRANILMPISEKTKLASRVEALPWGAYL